MKLDIACGQRKLPGFKGIDLNGQADIRHDLFSFPWPIAAGSVTQANVSHFAEHIPHHRPGWEKDGFFLFWEEVYRICRNRAKVIVTHPYSRNDRAFWDPTHERFIHEMTWYYLDAEWRKAQGLDHYPTSADFTVELIQGLGVADSVAQRSAEAQQFARDHYFNVIPDLQVTLRARKHGRR